MNYNFSTDEVRYLRAKDLLKIVSEEDIFSLVFGYKPVEYDYVISPFRIDNNPKCWFETNASGKLVFRDYAQFTRGIDCFEAVGLKLNTQDFNKILTYISDILIHGKKLKPLPVVEKIELPVVKSEIFVTTRNFNLKDRGYWMPYGIRKKDLVADGVFAVDKFFLRSKRGESIIDTPDLCYVYTKFEDGKKKIYRPFAKKRFITNCNSNDIGCYDGLPFSGETIIISKSYKDCRVLKNQGYNSIWFQNEGMTPSSDQVAILAKRFRNFIVFFDNDTAGVKASRKVTRELSSVIPGRVRSIVLPNGPSKDPADYYVEKGKEELKKFLNKEINVKNN